MNFIDLKVSNDGGVVTLTGEGSVLRPDDALSALLRNSGLDTVTVGFRPEHLEVGSVTGPGLDVTLTIDVIEFLGNDVLIHGSSGGRDVVAIVDVDNTLKVGDSVVLSAAPRRLHAFNPVSLARMIGTG
jgi:ABC-type sugar transport system ATPase subunit